MGLQAQPSIMFLNASGPPERRGARSGAKKSAGFSQRSTKPLAGSRRLAG
jgi:hypothetical protein